MKIDRDVLRRGWPWLASGLVVLVTVTIVVVTNTRDDRVAVPSGRFVPSSYTMDARSTSKVMTLPTGVLTVSTTKPLTEVRDSAQWRERRPADGGRFVGITTQLAQTRVPPTLAGSEPTEAISTPFSVAVVADGRRYPLRAAGPGPTAYSPPTAGRLRGYVAVAGNPREIAVEVDFDGQRQTVNMTTGRRSDGRFGELAETPGRFTERDCPSVVLPTGYRTTEFGGPPSCIVENAVRSPWVAGLGWAPAGRTWQAVAVYLGRNLDLESTASGARYSSAQFGNRTTMTLAGQPSKGDLAGNSAPPERRTSTFTGLFLVARGSVSTPVVVSMIFPNMVRADDAPESAPLDPTLAVSWKVPLS